MNILSEFDGMSCAMLALIKAGVKVTNYFSSEIDKYANQISEKNFPEIKRLGNVLNIKISDLPKIDLFVGGSPCQGFSFAGKQLNFEDPRSKLFFEFAADLRYIQEFINPDVKFLLENVKMKKEHQDVITRFLGVKPVEVNSALVSAQNRKRLYWTNIPGFIQPEDKGILLKDVLEFEFDPKWLHSEKAIEYMGRPVKGGRNHWDFGHHSESDKDKAACLTQNISKGVPYNVLISDEAISRIKRKNYSKPKVMPNKTGALNTKNNSPQLSFDSGTTFVPVGKHLRRLTPIECERLQTLPDNYTIGVSDTQRYRMLGNGWTVDVIAHIFKGLLKDEFNEPLDF